MRSAESPGGASELAGKAKRVAVIGAGAAGMATGRFLRDAGLAVTVFERAPAVGGVWRYEQP